MIEANQDNKELVITRIFDAPRELVWKAWTEPERFMRWWGPKDFTSPACKIDLRLGGKYLSCMRGPDGQDYWSTGVYREIVEPERIAYTDSFADEHGNVVPASHYGLSAGFPLELQVTVTFEDYGGKTKMTLKHVGIPAGEMSDMTGAGWNESFDKLAESLK
ncbi:MAG TPA: SRPBCC domain-containing protein [Anaerolineales bacterium]|nr:SRPBCC domain-containing protein [Anaerolineales bacterium]